VGNGPRLLRAPTRQAALLLSACPFGFSLCDACPCKCCVVVAQPPVQGVPGHAWQCVSLLSWIGYCFVSGELLRHRSTPGALCCSAEDMQMYEGQQLHAAACRVSVVACLHICLGCLPTGSQRQPASRTAACPCLDWYVCPQANQLSSFNDSRKQESGLTLCCAYAPAIMPSLPPNMGGGFVPPLLQGLGWPAVLSLMPSCLCVCVEGQGVCPSAACGSALVLS
jgi:hypothetical protein